MPGAWRSQVFDLKAHGHHYRIEASGIVAKCAAEGHPYEVALLEHVYKQGFAGLAVDAGAHIGNHTLWFAAICNLDVIAFEPSGAVDELRGNVHLNKLEDRVRVEQIALGAVPGRARLVDKGRYVAEPWSDMCTELKLDRGHVEVRTLDSYELQDVAVIKADVEGMEALVMQGAIETIRRCRPVVYAEAWDADHSTAVADVLATYGYDRTAKLHTATPVEEWRCCL